MTVSVSIAALTRNDLWQFFAAEPIALMLIASCIEKPIDERTMRYVLTATGANCVAQRAFHLSEVLYFFTHRTQVLPRQFFYVPARNRSPVNEIEQAFQIHDRKTEFTSAHDKKQAPLVTFIVLTVSIC